MTTSSKEDFERALGKMAKLQLSEIPKEMECPFTWTECTERFDEIDWITFLRNKLSKKDSNDWRIYCFKMLLGCMYAHTKEELRAKDTLLSCEKFILDKSNDSFFSDIVEGLQHVILSCKFYMNLTLGKKEVAEEIRLSIKPFNELKDVSQAAVWAVKAYVLCEFGYDGLVEALKCSKLAVKLDPDKKGNRRGAYYYLTGKIHLELRRVRSFNEMACDEELDMLEKSVKRNPFPIHVVVLADSYREAAKVLLKKSYAVNKPKSDDMCTTSKKIEEDAMAQENLTVSVLKRCGMGLMKLPSVFRNLPLAKKAFEMALSIAPNNPTALLGMGYLMEWHENDTNAALTYFKRSYACGNHGAGIQIIMMKYQLNKAYNPLRECDKFISNLKYSLKSRISLEWKVAFLSIKGEYHLFVEKNLLEAARNWEEAIDSYPDATNLWEYRYIFEKKKQESNIYSVLIKKIIETLRQRRVSKNDEMYLQKILNKCKANLLVGQNRG